MSGNRKHLVEVKNRIFKMTLFISIIAFAAISVINIFNRRPVINFIVPFGAALLVSACYWLYNRDKYTRLIRLVYAVFLFVLYLPLAWTTSPGSYSAMSFYAVLIVFLGVILAREWFDYIFPVITIAEVVYFLNIEPLNTTQYGVYSALPTRAMDLSINFIVVCIIIYAILMVLNRFFDSEHERIYEISVTDQLTGIYNRRHLYHQIETYSVEKTASFAILMMDLNNFKRVNDTYGHVVGDEVLRAFGEVLRKACRKMDLPVRYGGDEFILVLPETDVQDVSVIQSRIKDFFKPISEKYAHVGLSISFGVATSEGKSIEEIMQMADDHLYKNKNALKSMVTL